MARIRVVPANEITAKKGLRAQDYVQKEKYMPSAEKAVKLIKVWCVTNTAIKREEQTWFVCRTEARAKQLARVEGALETEGIVRVEHRVAVMLGKEAFVLSGIRLGFAEIADRKRRRPKRAG